MKLSPKLIISLGNPDPQYAQTYHNAGHLFLDFLTESGRAEKARLVKSEVFMNESGKFTLAALKKNNLKSADLLLVHDDSDLTLGNYKFSFGRGAAGHKGVTSVMRSLKTKDFWRLRIGVRPAKERVRKKAEEFVLKKISAADFKTLKEVFVRAAQELFPYI